jgi:hypothetical protein
VKYRDGYKYQLAEDESLMTGIKGFDINTDFIRLEPDGRLTAKKGYAWDGASGPTWDSSYCMRGPLHHDCLYQLLREQQLPHSYRKIADDIMYLCIIEDGMRYANSLAYILRSPMRAFIQFRANYWYQGVRLLADSACLPQNDRKVYEV